MSGLTCTDRAPGAARGAVGAGLVLSKTSVHDTVSLDWSAPARRERRISRLRMNVWSAGRLMDETVRSFGKAVRPWFVTLTYDTRGTLGNGQHDWEPRHISDALLRFRRWCKRWGAPVRYVWVAELQQRGTVHYHLVIWLPSRLSMPKWDKATSHGAPFWPCGMANVQRLRSGVAYLMKYMSKIGKHHEYPKGCRAYGVGGIEQALRPIRTWLNYPQWLRSLAGIGDAIRVKGGHLLRSTGELLSSPYRVEMRGGIPFLRTVAPVPDRYADGPYSSFFQGD